MELYKQTIYYSANQGLRALNMPLPLQSMVLVRWLFISVAAGVKSQVSSGNDVFISYRLPTLQFPHIRDGLVSKAMELAAYFSWSKDNFKVLNSGLILIAACSVLAAA
ncbi:MAG: hypothetical protein U5L96_11440 [Owenweeksia sp.]|nr:hypothetical protein [Owenweeksia sp.]